MHATREFILSHIVMFTCVCVCVCVVSQCCFPLCFSSDLILSVYTSDMERYSTSVKPLWRRLAERCQPRDSLDLLWFDWKYKSKTQESVSSGFCVCPFSVPLFKLELVLLFTDVRILNTFKLLFQTCNMLLCFLQLKIIN